MTSKKERDTKFVVVDLKHLGTTTTTPTLFSNIKSIIEQGILNEGKELNYNQLRHRLNKSVTEKGKSYRYWKNERYIIKECEIIKSDYAN